MKIVLGLCSVLLLSGCATMADLERGGATRTILYQQDRPVFVDRRPNRRVIVVQPQRRNVIVIRDRNKGKGKGWR